MRRTGAGITGGIQVEHRTGALVREVVCSGPNGVETKRSLMRAGAGVRRDPLRQNVADRAQDLGLACQTVPCSSFSVMRRWMKALISSAILVLCMAQKALKRA